MSVQVPRSVHVPLAIASLGALLVILLVVAAGHSAFAEKVAMEPAVDGRAEVRDTPGRCTHCGIVVSTERLAPVGEAPAVYQVTVRLADRSTRVFSDSNVPRWRPGERIVLIEGGNSPRN
jgi:hypothetical protein